MSEIKVVVSASLQHVSVVRCPIFSACDVFMPLHLAAEKKNIFFFLCTVYSIFNEVYPTSISKMSL